MTEQNPPQMEEEAASSIFEETSNKDIQTVFPGSAADGQEPTGDGEDTNLIRINASVTPQEGQRDVLKVNYTKPWGSLLEGTTEHAPGTVLTGSIWEFNAKMIQSIVQTGRLGYAVEYPTNSIAGGERIAFYVPDRARKTVRTTATILSNGVTYNIVNEHNIYISSPHGTMNRNDFDYTKVLTDEFGKMFVQLGNTKTKFSKVPGFSITFDATVSMENDKGHIGVMQFLNGGITYHKANGTVVDVNTGGVWFLDKRSEAPALTYGENGMKEIAFRSPASISVTDSPFIQLHDDVKKVVFDETFRTYLVYINHLPNSRWVPLGFVEWRWSGELERPGSSSAPWPTRLTKPSKFGITIPYTLTDELPRWVGETGQLSQRINTMVAPSNGDLQPNDWKWPTQNAKQMIITTVLPHTPQLVSSVENAIGCPVSKSNYGINVLPVWASPEKANEAKKVAGVAKVEELSADARYNVKPATIPHERHFVVYVAPFFWYNDNNSNMQFSNIVAPKTVAEVGQDLINICNSRGHGGATYTIRSFSIMYFDFPNIVTDENVLRAMAAHPQVNFVQRLTTFVAIDDPTNPTS